MWPQERCRKTIHWITGIFQFLIKIKATLFQGMKNVEHFRAPWKIYALCEEMISNNQKIHKILTSEYKFPNTAV